MYTDLCPATTCAVPSSVQSAVHSTTVPSTLLLQMPQVEIVMCKGGRAVASLPELPASATVEQVKRALGRVKPGLADINRQVINCSSYCGMNV